MTEEKMQFLEEFSEMTPVREYLKQFLEGIMDSDHTAHPLATHLYQACQNLKPTHGEIPQWNQAVLDIQALSVGEVDPSFTQDEVSFRSQLNKNQMDRLKNDLMKLNPWRKGPFKINNMKIDTEWQSSMKWKRLEPWIQPHLKGKNVLDIGCSSGYYMYRMLSHEPNWVMGVDPTWVFFYQFLALQSLVSTPRISFLPIGSEALDGAPRFFDTVFCMGILYHRKSPFEFIRSLQMKLKPGGVLILETLMVPGTGHWALTPVDRYARMRNCFTLPTRDAMIYWLQQFGFKDVEWIHDDWTSPEEQRTTDWMQRESLKECLDPQDSYKTVEGYPAPRRCLLKATAK